ncbi:MAG TPA: hypothetical protein PLT75_04420 [Spirochaetota bacterium]|nr:hypothetical protein [Spirochaetota bacterium]
MFRNRNRRGSGRGRGCGCRECICPRCKTVIPHQQGTPCFHVQCPRCNTPMMARLRFEEEAGNNE